MHFMVRLREDAGQWVAETESIEAEGRGATPAAAMDELRSVLVERFTEPHAVAPPSARGVVIDLQLMPR